MENLTNKNLSREEKTKLAEVTIRQLLIEMGFNPSIIGQFLWGLDAKVRETEKMIEKIEHGTKRNYPVDRCKVVIKHSQVNCLSMVLDDVCERGNHNLINSLNLDSKIVWSKKFKESREIIILCTLQLIEVHNQITDTVKLLVAIIKYLRGELEVNRMQLHLAGMPSYSVEIKHVDLFIKILESKKFKV